MTAAIDSNRGFVDAFNRHDLRALRAMLADDVRSERPNIVTTGADQLLALLEEEFQTFPDLAITLDLVLAHDNTVFSEYIKSGTHQGALVLPDGTTAVGNGRQMTVRASSVDEWCDGLLVATRAYWDNLDAFRQLGLIPTLTR